MHDLEISSLIQRGEQLPDGDLKVQTLEAAVQLADSRKNEALAFLARLELVECASGSGHWEKVPLHFPWLLAKAEAKPGVYPFDAVLWRYLGAVQCLVFFPQIPLAQIHLAQQDMTERFRKAGRSDIHALHVLFLNAIETGNMELAQSYHAQLESLNYIGIKSKGIAGDDSAHNRYCRGWFRTLIGQDLAGLAELLDVIDQRSHTRVIKGFALGVALPVMLRNGKTERLGEITQRAIREIRGRKELIEPYASLITFLAYSGNLDKLIALLPEFAAWTETSTTPFEHYQGLLAMIIAMRSLQMDQQNEIKLQLPTFHPLFQESGEYSTAALVQDYILRAQHIANQFDQRNGNNWFAERLKEASEDMSGFIPFPL